MKNRARSLVMLVAFVSSSFFVRDGAAQPPTPPATTPTTDQGVLGPGLYVFQTRIDHATCGDADRTGDVTSYYAVVDGIPGSRTMRMSLLNSTFWPRWTVSVTDTNHVIGEARQEGVTGPNQGESHFELAFANQRFTGRGSRVYARTVDGQVARCRVSYDALLRQIDR